MLTLADYGQQEVFTNFGTPLYFSQSLIAGAVLSGLYDTVVIVTPSQYGKSYLLGRVALLRAKAGHRTYVAGATSAVTDIIMQHMIDATATAANSLKAVLIAQSGDKLKRYQTSLSKKKIAMTTGGSVEAITLGDTYGDLSHNKAVGRGGDYIVDEAAMASQEALQELGRRDFNGMNGTRSMLTMISNPHKPGIFYDALTEENPSERTFILWIDALTAVEEERFEKEQVLQSEFARHTDTLQRYLLCELPTDGVGMFATPKVSDERPKGTHYIGVDPAYKGKDNLCIADISVNDDGVYVHDIMSIQKTPWIDGVTSMDVADTIHRYYRSVSANYMCVDIGQGIWLTEELERRLPYQVSGIGFGTGPTRWRVQYKHYAATNARNMRAELHLDMQSLIESDKITFSPEAWEKVKDVFPFIIMERKQGSGKVQVRSKEEIRSMLGRSPDELDAVLLAVHAAIIADTEEDFIT